MLMRVREQRVRGGLQPRVIAVSSAVVLLAVGLTTTGDWGRLLGAVVAAIVLVPLFWLLEHPRRRRRRLRAVETRR